MEKKWINVMDSGIKKWKLWGWWALNISPHAEEQCLDIAILQQARQLLFTCLEAPQWL